MSTRCVIARQTGDEWQGRYLHSDGYPTSRVPSLLALVERDGVERVTEMLVDTYAGWSVVRPTQADFSGVRIAKNADHNTYEYGTPQQQKLSFRQSYAHDNRFVNVPGYGIAYTAKQDGLEMYGPKDDPDAGWTYVLTDKAVLALERSYGNDFTSWTWVEVGRFPFGSTPTEQALTAAECGENFERCVHYAWRHFPEAEGTMVGVDVWLGRELPTRHDLATVCVRGRWLTLTGSGGTGTATDSRYNPIASQRYWWAGVKRADGSAGKDVRLGRVLKEGFRLDYDATAPTRDGDVVVSKGELIRS